MEITKLVDYVNRGYIASDRLRAPDIYYYIDMVIDDINERLQAKFPVITNWNDFVAGWNASVEHCHNTPDNMPTIPFEPPRPNNPYNPFDNAVPHHFDIPMMPEYRDPCICEEHMPDVNRPNPGNIPWHKFPPLPHHVRSNSNYDAFPDEYLRTVVALGVATKFYTRDEEGEQVALDYQNRYEMALFKMVRDYHNQVPWYFQDRTGGFIDFSCIREAGPHDLTPRGVVMRGNNTRNL